MAGTVTLSVIAGPPAGRSFAFTEHDTFIFGRADDCHAALPEGDRNASRHHFLLEVNPPYARIRDLGSLNGTYVNDRKYGGRERHETPEDAAKRHFPEVDLKHGDRIRVGNAIFSVAIEVPPPAKTERNICVRCGARLDGDSEGGLCRGCLDTAAQAPDVVLRRQVMGGADAPYELGRLLGMGSMGAVYLARRRADDRQVALKLMLPRIAVDDAARVMFNREIEIIGALNHPHVLGLVDRGERNGAFYFAMDYCPGGNLGDLRRQRGGRLTPREAVPLVIQALDGLAAAHAEGFVHRDLKPENILLSADQRTARISDFGLAKSFERAGLSGFTAVGTVGGTYVFMAREQLTNFKHVKPVTDVWSMAAVLFVLLTGTLPRPIRRGEDPVEVILRGDMVPIASRDVSLSGALAAVVDRGLADKAAERYATASAFRDALRGALG